MPAPLSIIIPTLNTEASLAACLASLVAGVPAGLVREVVVADGGSEDATLSVADTAGCVMLTGPPGRGAQLIAGAAAARGDWLLFLHADTVLSPDWVERTLDHVAVFGGHAGAFQLAYRSDAQQARWLERRANLRARWLGLAYGDQGLLISRGLYDEVGGYKDQPLMEDVALVRAIGRRRLRLLSAQARTDASKYERDGWRRRAYANAWLLGRYLAGASPHKLAAAYW